MNGVAIVDLSSAMGTLPLTLAVTTGGTTTNVDLGSVSVTTGSGKAPKVNSAVAVNKSAKTKLTVTGKKLTGGSIAIVPTDRDTSADPSVKGSLIKANFSSSECIPNGSFVNVTTAGGTAAKKIKVRGSCSNSL